MYICLRFCADLFLLLFFCLFFSYLVIVCLLLLFCFIFFFEFFGNALDFSGTFFLFFSFSTCVPLLFFRFFLDSRFFFELLFFLFGGFEFLFELLDWFFFVMWFLFFLNFPDSCGILKIFFERIATLRSSPALLGVAQGSLMKMYHPPSFDMTLWRPEDVTKDETFKSQAVEKTCRHHRYHQTSWEFLRWDQVEIW